MKTPIDGIYAVYLTGSAGQGFALLSLQDGTIFGSDQSGAKYDGKFIEEVGTGYKVDLTVGLPPNVPLIQGGVVGPQGERHTFEFLLPKDFLSRPFIRIEGRNGPVNARFEVLRMRDD
jgi:hypothetical protein